jgi:hypothetical protein
LEFLFNSNVRSEIKRKKEAGNTPNCFSSHPFLLDLISWKECGAQIKAPHSLVLQECWRLSEKAVAYLISQTSAVKSAVFVLLLDRYSSAKRGDEKAKILDNILQHLHHLSPGNNQVAKIICEFFVFKKSVSLSLKDPFLDSLVLSLHEVCSSFFFVKFYLTNFLFIFLREHCSP